MSLRTRLIRLLDEEIPISPREFTVEARAASIEIARWQRAHPEQGLSETIAFNVLKNVFCRYWSTEAATEWESGLRRVAKRAVNGDVETIRTESSLLSE